MKLTVVIVALLGFGCSASFSPTSIVVTDKEERTGLERQFRGLATGPTGQVEEIYRYVEVSEFWVRSKGGQWYRVDERTWRAAEVGQPLRLRGDP